MEGRDRKNDRNRNACLCRAGNRAFLLLNLNISEFTEGLFDSFIHPRQGIRGKNQGNRQGNEKKGILRREILEAQEVLELTGRGGTVFNGVRRFAHTVFDRGGLGRAFGEFALSPGFGVRIFVSPVLVCEADRAPLQKGCIGGAGNSVVRDNDGIP